MNVIWEAAPAETLIRQGITSVWSTKQSSYLCFDVCIGCIFLYSLVYSDWFLFSCSHSAVGIHQSQTKRVSYFSLFLFCSFHFHALILCHQAYVFCWSFGEVRFEVVLRWVLWFYPLFSALHTLHFFTLMLFVHLLCNCFPFKHCLLICPPWLCVFWSVWHFPVSPN